MNARISLPLLFAVLVTLLLSCGGKSDEPRVDPSIENLTNPVEMKYDVSIHSTSPINVSFVATKGTEPNIYRDGKLVAQGNYSSEFQDRLIRSLNTTFSHKGRAFIFGILLSLPHDGESTSSTVSVVVKMYKQGKSVQTFTKEINLTEESNSAEEQFQLWATK